MKHNNERYSSRNSSRRCLQLKVQLLLLKVSSFHLRLQFVDVIKKSVACSCLFGAVLVTLARLDHHHHPADDVAISAPEADR